MIDRRAAPRVSYSATATIFVASKTVACWIVDISSKGALLVPVEKVPTMQFVRLNMTLPGLDQLLDIDAVVVRETESSGRYAVGVQFQTNPRMETLIRTYVEWAKARQASERAPPPPLREPIVTATGAPSSRLADLKPGEASVEAPPKRPATAGGARPGTRSPTRTDSPKVPDPTSPGKVADTITMNVNPRDLKDLYKSALDAMGDEKSAKDTKDKDKKPARTLFGIKIS